MHMRIKSDDSKPGQNSGYAQNRARRTYFCTILMAEGQLWPFLRMRNSKIRLKIAEANPAKTWSNPPKINVEKKTSPVQFC